MRFKIHFEVGGYEDYFIVNANTIEECQEMAKQITDNRGLDEKTNNLWSEEIES